MKLIMIIVPITAVSLVAVISTVKYINNKVFPQEIPRETTTYVDVKSVLKLQRTGQYVPKTNDPIWELKVVVDDEVIDTIPALTGRAYRQDVDRNIAGNKSPLPKGLYSILSRQAVSGPQVGELGDGYWVPIVPLFSTGRTSLGIHHDPSWGKTNGESGTSGCIGLKTPEETQKLVNLIQKYNITQLIVES